MKFSSLFHRNTCLIVCLICSFLAFSQNQDDTNDFWRHVRFGGGLGLSFGDGFFSGTIAPSGIYEFNSQFAAGLGLNATYNKQDDFFKSTIFGASLIGLFNPIRELQLSTEFEQLNVNRKFDDSNYENQNYWYPGLYMGIGYRSDNVTFGIRYDVLYDKDKSIYADPYIPFVRVYF
ncbi:alpha-ketoglutarate decarboxylase [Psychroserpens ponticola]|uniref:Alpha-ketoglutarate decarboxylase n=1 Tax=Psychroserpens ponticola TaxID=2932268 RepID=A0ABY7S0D6_9FLAO|nr:alpha-ketoglutarate decarboxylase [Psychroserpens ponticola]WCO01936.1 alpha-ketoglutarate decarboxylase [Psychroserpens ponticola]